MAELEKTFAQLQTRQANKVAALDIGSNSFHLVVARIVAGSVQILHRVKRQVRLADGLNQHNQLSQQAIQRGLDCLRVMAESIQGFAPDSVRIVATYTLRKAVNAADFISAAADILPYPIEVISGSEEARLIYAGVAHTKHTDGQRLVVDIGGGSTEFAIGQEHQPILLRSLQMGCVSYSQRFFPAGKLTSDTFAAAITCARQELEIIEEGYRDLGWVSCTGTSGTIRTLMTLCQNLPSASTHHSLSLSSLEALAKACIQAGHIDKLTFTGLSDERRPVFAAGLAILIAICKSLQIKSMEYSTAALREGVIYEMEAQLTQPNIRERTAQSLATRYDVDITQAKLVLTTTMQLYDQVATDWHIDLAELKSMLGWAALLHEIGLHINSRGVQRHSAYILDNVELPGFNQEQQKLLATLVRYHRKKIRQHAIPQFYQYQHSQINKLISLLRLAVLLNIKRQKGILPSFQARVDKQQIHLQFPPNWLANKPIFTADLTREADYSQALGISLLFA